MINREKSYSFNVCICELSDLDSILNIINKPEAKADLTVMKPGFSNTYVTESEGYVYGVYNFPFKDEIPVLKEGALRKLEIPTLSLAEFYFFKDKIIFSGKKDAIKFAFQMLSAFLDFKHLKISSVKMVELLDEAEVVKNIKYRNIPNSEIDSASYSGEFESDFRESDLPLRDSEISQFTGIYKVDHDVYRLGFSSSGKISVKNTKKEIMIGTVKKIADMAVEGK